MRTLYVVYIFMWIDKNIQCDCVLIVWLFVQRNAQREDKIYNTCV